MTQGTSHTFFPKVILWINMNNLGNGQGGFIYKKNIAVDNL